MHKKGAIGLSINLLVIIIISLVILGFGITFLYNLIGGAEDIKTDLDSRTEAELERLLIDEGKRVALPRHTANVPRGESHTFGLGILNIDQSTYGDQFSITVELSKAVDENSNIMQADTSSWLLYNAGRISIQENEHHTEAIFVKVPKDALKGTYIFNVQVWSTPGIDKYDNLKKFTVNVKS